MYLFHVLLVIYYKGINCTYARTAKQFLCCIWLIYWKYISTIIVLIILYKYLLRYSFNIVTYVIIELFEKWMKVKW